MCNALFISLFSYCKFIENILIFYHYFFQILQTLKRNEEGQIIVSS